MTIQVELKEDDMFVRLFDSEISFTMFILLDSSPYYLQEEVYAVSGFFNNVCYEVQLAHLDYKIHLNEKY